MGGSGSSAQATDFFYETSLGNVVGTSNVFRSGANLDVGTTFEDIWSIGGQMVYLVAPETMDIVSTSAFDESFSLGAQTVLIIGLDGNFDVISEVVSMNGVTPVTTTNTYLRIQNMFVATAGTNEINNGDISATSTTSGNPQGQIQAEKNASMFFQFSVPNGQSASVVQFSFTGGAGDAIDFEFYIRFFGGLFSRQNLTQVNGATFLLPIHPYVNIPEKSDVRILAKKTTGGGVVSATSVIQMFFIDN